MNDPGKTSLLIVVLIRTNPYESPRGVEAIRMALGLSSGVHRVTVILTGESPILLSEDLEEVLDSDILERYISSFDDSDNPFYIEEGFLEKHPDFETDFSYQPASREKIAGLIASGDKFLIF